MQVASRKLCNKLYKDLATEELEYAVTEPTGASPVGDVTQKYQPDHYLYKPIDQELRSMGIRPRHHADANICVDVENIGGRMNKGQIEQLCLRKGNKKGLSILAYDAGSSNSLPDVMDEDEDGMNRMNRLGPGALRNIRYVLQDEHKSYASPISDKDKDKEHAAAKEQITGIAGVLLRHSRENKAQAS
jgi:hypothetical protein